MKYRLALLTLLVAATCVEAEPVYFLGDKTQLYRAFEALSGCCPDLTLNRQGSADSKCIVNCCRDRTTWPYCANDYVCDVTRCILRRATRDILIKTLLNRESP